MGLPQTCGVPEAPFSPSVWVNLALAVVANLSADTIFAIGRHFLWRVRREVQSEANRQFNFKLVRPDGTTLEVGGSDTDTALKAVRAGLAAIQGP
jgi:hypothetical protein